MIQFFKFPSFIDFTNQTILDTHSSKNSNYFFILIKSPFYYWQHQGDGAWFLIMFCDWNTYQPVAIMEYFISFTLIDIRCLVFELVKIFDERSVINIQDSRKFYIQILRMAPCYLTWFKFSQVIFEYSGFKSPSFLAIHPRELAIALPLHPRELAIALPRYILVSILIFENENILNFEGYFADALRNYIQKTTAESSWTTTICSTHWS